MEVMAGSTASTYATSAHLEVDAMTSGASFSLFNCPRIATIEQAGKFALTLRVARIGGLLRIAVLISRGIHRAEYAQWHRQIGAFELRQHKRQAALAGRFVMHQQIRFGNAVLAQRHR